METPNLDDGLTERRPGPRVEIDQRRLQTRRLQAGLSQAELATASGLSRITINAIENGKSTPRLHTAARIAKALGLPLAELIGTDPVFRPWR